MNSPAGSAGGVSRGLIDYTHVIYALFALSVLAAFAGLHAVLALREGRALPLPARTVP